MNAHRFLHGMIFILAIYSFVPGNAAGQTDYRTTVLNTPGILAYWPFTPASGTNSVVGGYTGTFQGGATFGAPGTGPALAVDPANRPVSLNGVTGTYVNTNLTGVTGTSASIVGWFNISALPSTTAQIYTIASQSQVANDFDIQIETDNKVRFYTASGASVTSTLTLTATDIGVWHFIAATFSSGGNRSLYIDGNAADVNAAGTHSPSTGTFAIGSSNVFAFREFHGDLDEIALYNRELTSTEVADIYASRLTAVPEPTTLALVSTGVGMGMIYGTRRYLWKTGKKHFG